MPRLNFSFSCVFIYYNWQTYMLSFWVLTGFHPSQISVVFRIFLKNTKYLSHLSIHSMLNWGIWGKTFTTEFWTKAQIWAWASLCWIVLFWHKSCLQPDYWLCIPRRAGTLFYTASKHQVLLLLWRRRLLFLQPPG